MKDAHLTYRRFDRYSGIELRHLRLVWTVAEERSLTRAAGRLRLTPSALSHQLRGLEGVVGGSLFRRTGRAMDPTPAGDVLLEASARVLDIVADAEDRLARQQAGHAGIVRLATHCYTGYQWLPTVVRLFMARYPGAEVRVVGEATRRPVEALIEKQIDVAITTEKPVEPGLCCRPVLRDEVKLLLPADHPLARRTWIGAEDIARQHLISYAETPERSAFCMEVLRAAGCWPAKFTSIQLTEAIIEMVRAGLGVTILAEWALQGRLGEGLVARRITRGGWRRTWHAITWPREVAGQLVADFVATLTTTFGRSGGGVALTAQEGRV
jgi:LysR family transcriptional regulator for metE and metH